MLQFQRWCKSATVHHRQRFQTRQWGKRGSKRKRQRQREQNVRDRFKQIHTPFVSCTYLFRVAIVQKITQITNSCLLSISFWRRTNVTRALGGGHLTVGGTTQDADGWGWWLPTSFSLFKCSSRRSVSHVSSASCTRGGNHLGWFRCVVWDALPLSVCEYICISLITCSWDVIKTWIN